MPLLLRRLVLALGVTLVVLLLVEGGLSLVGGPRLAERLLGEDRAPAEGRRPIAGDEGPRGARDPERLYAPHPDPRVRYTLLPDAELDIVGGRATTDGLGFRVRPGPPPPEERIDVLVLGDSVAFGYGVDDDETLAAALEAALAQARGPADVPVVCRTLAVPGWNHRQAFAALVDHWQAYEPDIVIYIPISNDLSDANGVTASGQLHLTPDPLADDPLLLVSRSQAATVELALLDELAAGGPGAELLDELGLDDVPDQLGGAAHLGPRAVEADLSPESSRRFDANAETIVAMSAFLDARWAKLIVFLNGETRYMLHLAHRLRRADPELPILFGQRQTPPDMTLVRNNHPSAQTLAARSLWIARVLIGQGWVSGDRDRLPDVPPEYEELRMTYYRVGQLEQLSQGYRKADAAALLPEIVPPTGRGLRQVFGGLNRDGSARLHVKLLLAVQGPALDLALAPVPYRLELYPLDVRVEVDGVRVGVVTIGRYDVTSASLPLPGASAGASHVEVLLAPDRWTVTRDGDREQPAAFRLLRAATGPLDEG